MDQETIGSEINKEICEAVGCLAKATTEISVKVGLLGEIQLRLCKDCVYKFAGDKDSK
jgi:hypothetical protein